MTRKFCMFSIKHSLFSTKFIIYFSLMVFQTINGSLSYAISSGLSYQGRLLDTNNQPVVSTSVEFKIQIRTTGPENCLLFEETQTKDLSQTTGVFSLNINDGSGQRTDTNSYTIEQIFANRGSFTFPASYCTSGTGWTPNPNDGRQIQLFFNDGTLPTGQYDSIAAIPVNFVPMSLSALQIGGYNPTQLLKIADGVPTAQTEFSNTQWTQFLALLDGTSTQYLKSSDAINQLKGAALPAITGGESIRWNSGANAGAGGWEAFTPGSSVSVTSVTAGTGLNVGAGPGGSITTIGTLNVDTGTSANKILQLDSAGKIPAVDGSQLTQVNAVKLQNIAISATAPTTSGQILRYNGTQWVPNFIAMTDLRSSVTGASSFASNCGVNQTLTYNSVGDIMSCTSIGIDGSQVTAGTVGIAYGGTGATTQAGAANAILPSQTGNNGKFLTTNGTNVSWAANPSQWNNGASSSINYTAGDVGIGTTSLWNSVNYTTLTINGTNGGQIALEGGGTPQGYIYSSTANPLIFQNGSGTTIMAMTPGGNVGIGTTNPSYLFSVEGNNATFGAMGISVRNSNSAGDANVIVSGDNPSNNVSLQTIGTTAGAYANTSWLSSSGSISSLGISTNGDVSTGGNTPIEFITGGYSNAVAMYISPGNPGNVGIGTTVPTATLDVNGTLRTRSGINSAVRVVAAAGAVTVTTADYIICVKKTVGEATIVNLPSGPNTGDQYIIKDCKGDANTNNITIVPAAGNIDGAANFVMSNARQSIGIFYDGTQWEIY